MLPRSHSGELYQGTEVAGGNDGDVDKHRVWNSGWRGGPDARAAEHEVVLTDGSPITPKRDPQGRAQLYSKETRKGMLTASSMTGSFSARLKNSTQEQVCMSNAC